MNKAKWSIKDESYTTKGADPTHNQAYVLTLDAEVIHLREFMGYYELLHNRNVRIATGDDTFAIDLYLLAVTGMTWNDIQNTADRQNAELANDPMGNPFSCK